MGDIAKRHFYPFEMGKEINFYGHLISKKQTQSLRILASEERVDLPETRIFDRNTNLSKIQVGLNKGAIWEETEDFLTEIRGFISRFNERRANLDDHSLLRNEAPSIWTKPKHPLEPNQ